MKREAAGNTVHQPSMEKLSSSPALQSRAAGQQRQQSLRYKSEEVQVWKEYALGCVLAPLPRHPEDA